MAVAAAALPSARVAASKLLQRIVSAVEPLKELNEGFSCLVSDGEIVIHSGAASGKSFRISVERDMSDKADIVRYVSPKTGSSYDYTWQPAAQRWFHAAAPHFIEDLLVRELMYYAKGVPAF